jgi:hypothetical protein
MFMPPGQTGSLNDQQYTELVAALLKANDVPPSETMALPQTKEELDAIQFLGTKP